MTGSDAAFEFLFGCPKNMIHRSVILTPFGPANRFAGGKGKGIPFKGRLYSGVNVENGGNAYTVVKCPIGASPAGDCVLFLGAAGCEKLVYSASCGGLDPSSIGEVIICRSAFPGGGFSDYYQSGADITKILTGYVPLEASCGILEEAWLKAKTLEEGGDVFRKGDIFSIGSLAAETTENMFHIREEGFIGIDMELAAVYQSARVSDMAAVGILYVSDLPSKRPFWDELSIQEKQKLENAAQMTEQLARMVISAR